MPSKKLKTLTTRWQYFTRALVLLSVPKSVELFYVLLELFCNFYKSNIPVSLKQTTTNCLGNFIELLK